MATVFEQSPRGVRWATAQGRTELLDAQGKTVRVERAWTDQELRRILNGRYFNVPRGCRSLRRRGSRLKDSNPNRDCAARRGAFRNPDEETADRRK